jgi:hypothetical protein
MIDDDRAPEEAFPVAPSLLLPLPPPDKLAELLLSIILSLELVLRSLFLVGVLPGDGDRRSSMFGKLFFELLLSIDPCRLLNIIDFFVPQARELFGC